jgi:hypothetical protein
MRSRRQWVCIVALVLCLFPQRIVGRNQAPSQAPNVPRESTKLIIENDRAIVWDVTWTSGTPSPMEQHQYDLVSVCLAGGAIKTTLPDGTSSVAIRRSGDVVFDQKGGRYSEEGVSRENSLRSIVINLRDHPLQPLRNTSGFPDAFPRPGVKKVLENNRVIVWDYAWIPGKPTPMHFHDKDTVVVYMDDGTLKSTKPNGESVVNEVSFGLTKFNARDRVHTEELVRGRARAIIVELK